MVHALASHAFTGNARTPDSRLTRAAAAGPYVYGRSWEYQSSGYYRNGILPRFDQDPERHHTFVSVRACKRMQHPDA